MKQKLQRSRSGGRERVGAGIQVLSEVAWPEIEALGGGGKEVDFEHILELYLT